MPYPTRLTPKERSYLEDALQMENLCIAKCSVYVDQCEDRAMKSLLFDLAKTKRRHAGQIRQLLDRSANFQYH